MSNRITFNTLKRPWIEVLKVNHDSVDLRIYLACQIQIIDDDLNYFKKHRVNSCHSYKVLFKEILQVNIIKTI
jgi:hypothetical protein